jgi:hypothetical protein
VKFRRPSPALLISCLALFISLGGVSYGVATGFIDSRELKNNTIRTQDIRNNDIRGKDIRNSTIGGRDVALNTLTGGDINESRLTTVPDAAALGGVAAANYLRADTTGFMTLTLDTGSTTPVPSDSPPAFDVDPLGYVHLRGSLLTNGSPALTLPAGARPATTSTFLASDLSNGALQVDIDTGGQVEVQGPGPVAFDGITFKAAP